MDIARKRRLCQAALALTSLCAQIAAAVVAVSDEEEALHTTTILHGLQGTMNRIIDILEKSVTQPVDAQAGALDEALDLLQTREDGLSLDDQKKLVNLFMKDTIIAQTYNSLVNEELRHSWIAEMLVDL